MYEKHFGLHRRPFLAKVSGSDVFVGPQTAQTMAGLRKALQVQDTVIAVTGPAGSGKSTLVAKALEAVAATHRTIRIGRMSLRGTDVLEFFLEELGVTDLPHGPIRQFAVLRAKLREMEARGTHVVAVVEDAMRLGVDTLAELEALTAADAGESAGAAIVVMGDERLREFLGDPQLARLAQRLRHRHEILPLSEPELRGYFIHSFRQAGGNFEQAFDSRSVPMIRSLSKGIPRVANNIAEAAMSAAAATGSKPISAELIADIAHKEFGLDGVVPEASAEPRIEPEPSVELPVTSEPPAEQPIAAELPAEPAIAFADEPADLDADIPELIQDTLPDLEVLKSELAGRDAASDAVTVVPDRQVDQAAPPTISAPQQPVAPDAPVPALESAAADVPDWDRDPTMAELKPDLDALEKAMAMAQGEADDGELPEPDDMPVLQPEPRQQEPVAEEIPEITLDNAIREKIDNNLIDEPGSVSTSTEEPAPTAKAADEMPEVRLPGKNTKKADAELERIAAELAKAKTIEDVDDKLAETLFGEELSLAAAEVVARVQAEQSANDGDLSLFDTDAAQLAQAVGSQVADGVAGDHLGDDANDDAGDEISLESDAPHGGTGLDLSASQRLNSVRALSAGQRTPTAPAPAGASAGPTEASHEPVTPASIEDQINTSMTQTLKALDVKPPVSAYTPHFDDEDEDEEEGKKSGFFSRFRRS